VLIVNNTVVGNGNMATASGGIILGGGSETTVDNTKIDNIVGFNATMGVRSFFPDWVMQPTGNDAYSNVGFGHPQGDFSTWQGGGIDYANGNIVPDPHFVDRGAMSPFSPGHRLRRDTPNVRARARHRRIREVL
jgi:hypothetical protein